MSKVIEETVKVLTEFESQLDSAKADASEARKRIVKNAGEWAQSAKASALARAEEKATNSVSQARKAAQIEADEIKKKGQAGLKKYEETMQKHMGEAAELVVSRLLGERS